MHETALLLALMITLALAIGPGGPAMGLAIYALTRVYYERF
ncbi:hypothetical protein [Nitratireductor sp. GCM10026969]